MQHKFLKLAGVKTEKEFYAKFPTEEAFFKAHPEAHPSFAKGGTVPSKDVNTGEFLNTRLGQGNSGQIVPLPDPVKPKLNKSATAADSLAVYNNTKLLAKYYGNGNYKKGSISVSDNSPTTSVNPVKITNNKKVTDDNQYAFDSFYRKDRKPIAMVPVKNSFGPQSIQPVDKGNYRKDINDNQYYQRELADGILDTRAPMTLFDKRITPQTRQAYTNVNKNDAMHGDIIDLYQYDPIAVKPYAMLTPAEKIIRDKKYPQGNVVQKEQIFPTPKSARSKPAVITSPNQTVDASQPALTLAVPTPQGDYVYGPANSVIGTNVNGKFTPINMPEQRGKVNQADWDMLNNQESMKKYVQGKGLQYKCGGKVKGKKAAWGAMLGTDQFSGGPDPVNPYPNGFNATLPKLDMYGNPVIGAPSVSGGTSTGMTGGITGGGSVGAPAVSGGLSDGTSVGAAPVSGGYSNGKSIGAPEMKGGYSDDTGVRAEKKPQTPQMKMPEGKGAEGSGGQAALMGLMAVSALMPKEKIRRRYVRPEDTQSYNPHPYGTGSQALSEYGSTLKGNKKKAFWGAIVGAVAGKAQNKAGEDKKNAFNNIQESLAPLMMISDKAQAEATRLDNLYLQGGVQNMQNLQQAQPQMLPNQQPQYMEHGGEMYGQGGELITGKGGQTELKSYNPYDGGTFQFNGASHEDGGIDISYKGQPAEVEGQETAFKDEQGDLKIMGNLKNPLTGSKYKDDLKRIADKEKKAQKLIDKGTLLINSANPEDAYEALAFNSGKAMAIGGMISQKRLAESKQHLGNMQEAHLEIAKEKNQHPDDIFAKGGTMGDPDPKKKWVYKDTNTKNLDAKIKVFADMLAAKGIEGYSGAGGGYRSSKTTSGRTSRHARNQALDIIPVAGEAAYQKILNDPELVNYMMTNGLTAINEYDPAIAKKTGATAGHLHIGYDKGTKLADKFRQDAISLYPDKYNSEPKYKMNDANGEMYTAKELAAAYGMTSADIKARVKSGVLSYMGGVTSQNYREPALNKGAGDAQTENYNGFVNKVYKIPPVHFTPKPMDIQTVQGSDTPMDLQQPAPLDKPSNARGISPMQFLGEGFALATNKEEPVKAQLYNPELYSPYQVSFQDRLNENQATFNAVEKQVAYDPTALATLAGQKYSANSAVLADEFRTNQGISNDIINKNVSLLNDAKFKNLGILDQQYVRQSQAKSNTKKINQDALSSISSKLLQKEASNNQLRVLENMYPDYAFNKRTGKAEYYGPDAASQIDWSGVQPLATAQPAKTQVETKVGNTKTTQYYEDPNIATLRALGVQEKQLNQFAPKKKSLSQWMKGG